MYMYRNIKQLITFLWIYHYSSFSLGQIFMFKTITAGLDISINADLLPYISSIFVMLSHGGSCLAV